MSAEITFEIEHSSIESKERLLIGLATPGMAGLTAVTHLIDTHERTQVGHVRPTGLPAIAPFEEGTPRHHTRLYDLADTDTVALVGELFIPPFASGPFVSGVCEWCAEVGIEEITLLHPVPYEHGPDDHRVFSIATEGYDTSDTIPPMAGGILDGVPGELLSRALATDSLSAGVFVTPAHAPGPDIDAALLYLDALETMFNVEIDSKPLEDLSREIRTHYELLAERLSAQAEADKSRAEMDFYADRMYM